MADVKISQLPASTVPLSGSELVPLVQSGVTVQTTVADIANKAPVTSVAGKTGVVTLTPSDVGAEPADATILKDSDIGVTVQAYNANTVIDAAYVHTDNNYTTTEKSKLAGIAAGAEVNVNADWNAVSGDAQILNKPTIPSKTSDLTNDSGFISSYTETDPIFSSHPAHNVTSTNLTEWAAAYNDKINSASFNTSTGILSLNQQDGGTVTVDLDGRFLTSYTETDPIYTASSWYTTTNNSSNWNTAYSWGNHATAGYLTSASIGTTVQAYDADLTSWAAIAPSSKQDTLVSGTNIKTINGNSLLGSGNLTISGGGSLAISDEGTSLTTGATSINFVGSGVTATASGTDVTVTIAGGGGGTSSSGFEQTFLLMGA